MRDAPDNRGVHAQIHWSRLRSCFCGTPICTGQALCGGWLGQFGTIEPGPLSGIDPLLAGPATNCWIADLQGAGELCRAQKSGKPTPRNPAAQQIVDGLWFPVSRNQNHGKDRALQRAASSKPIATCQQSKGCRENDGARRH